MKSHRESSYWADQRDIPDSRWGKTHVPGCECDAIRTCRACLDRCVERNSVDQMQTIPQREDKADV